MHDNVLNISNNSNRFSRFTKVISFESSFQMISILSRLELTVKNCNNF